MRQRGLRGGIGRVGAYGVMAVCVVTTLFPLIWMVSGALKSGQEFYSNIWGLPQDLTWANFARAWAEGGLGQKFANSIIVTAGTMAIVLPVTSLAGYALASIEFPGRRAVYVYLLLGIMVPFGVIAIPVFTVVVQLGLLNTLPGLILVYSAQSLPLGVFLMRSFFASIPRELEEAGLVDGCTLLGAFFRVVLPLAKPGLVTQLIFTGTTVWNEYFMASILLHREALQTLPLGLVTFTSKNGIEFPELFAASAIVTAPLVILYLIAQRQFIAGLSAGAVKG
ncbi:MAG: carbohydrate ABC transporter permease [Bifidobacteriaceae bacterium]|jgi:ABC-type glycerol-3-phosphate transport system permease component|nr:carbohydrate ABC transporter permease [Bifidobacteriaceae bacterium]